MSYLRLLVLACTAWLAACATQAPTFPSKRPNDAQLTCAELEAEMEKVVEFVRITKPKVKSDDAPFSSLGNFIGAIVFGSVDNELYPARYRIVNIGRLAQEKNCGSK